MRFVLLLGACAAAATAAPWLRPMAAPASSDAQIISLPAGSTYACIPVDEPPRAVVSVSAVPGGTLYHGPPETGEGGCVVVRRLPLASSARLALHTADASGLWRLIGIAQVQRPVSGSALDPVRAAAASGLPIVGALHTGGHALSYSAVVNITAAGYTPATVEGVLRSNGSVPLSHTGSEWAKALGLQHAAIWHSQPRDGFYCTYTRGPNASYPRMVPDCPNVTATLQRQAREMLAAGIAWVATDSTNLYKTSAFGEVHQARPNANLFATWSAMRAAGEPTPSIAIWQNIPNGSGADLWRHGLALYEAYPGVVLREPSTERPLFIVPDRVMDKEPTGPHARPDPAIVEIIEQAGIGVVRMWANAGPAAERGGLWSFMASCRDAAGTGTSSVVGEGASPCGQEPSGNSTAAPGLQLAVGPSFQRGYTSVWGGGAGKFGTLTLRRQFATAFALQAAGTPPRWVFSSDYNAFAQQPSRSPWAPPPPAANLSSPGFSMGLGSTADPGRFGLFVDTYGWGQSRDIAPTREGGSAVYDTYASCARVLALGAASLAGGGPGVTAGVGGGGPAACSVAGEPCCEFRQATDAWVTAFALHGAAGHRLTASAAERDRLVASGLWRRTCSPFNGPTAVCVNTSLIGPPPSPLAWQGPFILRNASALHAQGPARPSDAVTGDAIPLRVCRASASAPPFLAAGPACGEGSTIELLGACSPAPSGTTPRSLRRCCQGEPGASDCTHTVDTPQCLPSHPNDSGVLCFVH